MRLLLLFGVPALLVACNDDDNSGRSEFSTGADSSKLIKDLSAEELQAACDSMEQAISSVMTQQRACTAFGLMFAQDAQNCQEAVSACMSSPMEEEEKECRLSEEKSKECEATVLDMEGCINESLAGLESAMESLSCDLAGQATEPQEGGEELNPSCQSVQEQCPELTAEILPSSGMPSGG